MNLTTRRGPGPGVGVLALWSLAACATPPAPEPTLEAYRRALAEKDDATLRALVELPPERRAALEAALADPNWRLAAERSLEGALTVETWAEVRGPDGVVLRLKSTERGWRVADLDGLLLDSPERALATFFSAFQARDWPALRALVPEPARAEISSDQALADLVGQLVERVEAARAALAGGPLPPAVISQDTARLDYGPGRSVRFLKQGGRWRILDLE